MHSGGSLLIDYTNTSNQMIHEHIRDGIAHYFTIRKNFHFDPIDVTPGAPDWVVPNIGCTSDSAIDGFIEADDGPVDLSWLFAALNSRELAQPTVANLTSCIQGINGLIAKGRFELLSKVLNSANLAGMSNETMLAFARSSFPVRERISNWRRFTRNVKAELDRRGRDGTQLMKGLV